MPQQKKSLLDRYIPITDWIRDYEETDLRKDARAGLTVGVLLIPQSMAYAMLAGLPPVYGLYASIVPLIIYAIFGTSRHLGIGPVALISILVAAGLSEVATPGSSRYIGYALALSLFVGITQFLMGVFRLGFLMNFISKPVLMGFTSAAAFIIGFSQLGNLFGVELARSKYVSTILLDFIDKIGQVHPPTVIIGMVCIALILLFRWWKPWIPGPLIAIIGSILVVWGGHFDTYGVEIVGSVEQGYPAPVLPPLSSVPFWQLLPTILAIAFLGFTQSIALAKAMVRRNPNYQIDSNQELFGLGLANMAGSFFNAFPVAGSFSRTAVNEQNQARTSVSLLVSVGLVLASVLFLIPLMHYLPTAALAAIIMTAVPGLIEVRESRYLWKLRRREFALMLITFAATLAFGILQGMGIGVLISLVIVIHRTSYPNIVMLGRLPKTKTYRDLERYPEGRTQTNTIIVRVDASLYFANIGYMKEKLEELEVESEKSLNQIIIDATGINKVDSSALHALADIIEEYHSRDIDVYFASVKGPVRDLFRRAGIVDLAGGEDHFFLDIQQATNYLEEESEESSHLV